jgi:hypothetical protein
LLGLEVEQLEVQQQVMVEVEAQIILELKILVVEVEPGLIQQTVEMVVLGL